jgi:hypothetical protein
MFGLEPRHQPLAPRRRFLRRLAMSGATGLAMIAVSLLAGMLGYHYLEAQPWVDAFANAAMILSGMGPLGELHTAAGNSGLAVILITGIVFGPVVHRFLHRFHLEERQRRERGEK